jgi:hypothetical protein
MYGVSTVSLLRVRLPSEDRHNLLLELIEDAGDILLQPGREKASGYVPLESLAHELCRLDGTVSIQLLKEVAEACGLNCDHRTLQRYARQARLAFARGLRARSLLR